MFQILFSFLVCEVVPLQLQLHSLEVVSWVCTYDLVLDELSDVMLSPYLPRKDARVPLAYFYIEDPSLRLFQ